MDRAEILNLYRELMEEVKNRHEVLVAILRAAKDRELMLSPSIMGELCYLQLRYICELIAAACLVVHGDIPETQTSKMQKSRQADWIVNSLERLHPDFFPRAVTMTVDETGETLTITPQGTDYLTKADFLALYHECGSVLHRGSVREILAAKTRHMDLVHVLKIVAKITQLLETHHIALIDRRHEIWVTMKAQHDGKVHVTEHDRALERQR